jgi:hypothetical protein
VLANVFPDKLILSSSMQRRRQIGDGIPKAWIVE